MFKVLLKKQILEIFRSWFFNSKTGKARSKKGAVGMALLFIMLMVVVLGGSFMAVAIGISQPFISAGVGYLYFILFGLIALMLGLFGSVFNTFSSLYIAKDNDLLLSLPIPIWKIVASRLFSTYLIGTMYSSVVFVPGMIVYQFVGGFNGSVLIGNFIMMFEISILVWALSCLLGFVVAKISLKIKNRSFITVVSSVAFMGLYYFVYFKAQVFIRDMAENAATYGSKIKDSAYILYLWGQNGLGDLSAVIGCLLTCVAFAFFVWLILNKTFLNLATSTPKEKKLSTVEKKSKVNSLQKALLKKEFSRFTSSANYMLNCGLGVLFIPVMGVILLIKGNTIISMFSENIGINPGMFPISIVGIALMLSSMIDPAAPSISLEGKELWILQSLPIDPWQVLKAKIKMQLFLTEAPMIFFGGCILALNMSATDKIMCIISVLLYPVFSALFNMFLGVKMPILTWTSEIVPIKQSGGVAIALFGGWGFVLLFIGGYVGINLLLNSISAAMYLTAFAVLIIIACIILCHWLKNKGTEILG